MTMCFKTYEGESRHRAEGVNPYLSANYVTCGCYSIYASSEPMNWSSGEAMWCKADTQHVSLNIEAYDELLDWAFGDHSQPFHKDYVVSHMIGTTKHKCSAAFLPNGAIAITDQVDEKPGSFWMMFGGGRPETMAIFPDDLARVVIACHDMVIDDGAYSEAWLAMPLEVRRRHLAKDQTEADSVLWWKFSTASRLRADSRKLANRERWNVLP